MKNTELFYLLETLNEREFKDLRVYLETFEKVNAEKNVMKLLQFLDKKITEVRFKWDKIDLQKEEMYLAIFQKKMKTTKDDTNLRNLQHRFLKYLRNYCRFLQFRKNPEDTDYLLQYLSEREANEAFEIENRNYLKRIEEKNGVGVVEKKFKAFEIELNMIVKSQAKLQPDHQKRFDLFEDYVLIQKIQFYCYMLNTKLVSGFNFQEGFEQEIEQIFDIAKKRESIKELANLYCKAALILKQNDKEESEKKCEELEALLLAQKDDLDRKDRQLLFTFIHTYCNKNKKDDKEKMEYFKQKVNDNFFYRLEEGLLHEGGFLPVMPAKNLCTYILKKYIDEKLTKEETEKEMKKIIEQILPKYRDSTRKFHWGVLAFYFHDYKKTIRILEKKRKYANPFFDFDSRMILLRAYFLLSFESEKDTVDEFEKALRNFDNALENVKNFSVEQIQSYSNFTYAINNLYKILGAPDGKKGKQILLKKLKEYLEKNNVRVNWWFWNQIEALEKEYCL